MTKSKKAILYNVLIYFLAVIIIFALIISPSEAVIYPNGTSMIEIDPISTRDKAGVLLFGPINFVNNEPNAYAEISANNIPPNTGWVNGELSIIEAKHFQKDNKLLAINKIKEIINHSDKDENAKILEIYHTRFEIWNGDKSLWRDPSKTNLYFNIQVPKSYYFLVEYLSHPKSDTVRELGLALKVIQGKKPTLWFYFVIVIFAILFVLNLLRLIFHKENINT
ncbi:MAG: hypothetical protein OEV44_15115 [Spirochaetota bacterium]|nr:hypothetical protein [Spirochaetota bacterium]